jgi:DNA polymerase-3 subunit gamma/tau
MDTNTIDFCEKYRPRKFGEILGNKPAIQYLKNSALSGRITNSLILHGETGTGKNTLAHVFTKSITCENFQGEPCGECDSCKTLEAYYPHGSTISGVSLYDCTKLDEKRMDEIINRHLGFHSLNRIDRNIFIWDEFHQITDRWKDKLLNPESKRDIFIYCLIDLSVVSRALQGRAIVLKTERPEMGEIIPRLRQICELEGIIVKDEDALITLARDADRLTRECIKFLETSAVYGEPLTVNLVKKFFKHRRSIGNED